MIRHGMKGERAKPDTEVRGDHGRTIVTPPPPEHRLLKGAFSLAILITKAYTLDCSCGSTGRKNGKSSIT